MKAIWTKYLGPTNFRGSRVKASTDGVSVTVGYENGGHDAAAVLLAQKMGWPGTLVRGVRPDRCGNVYVFLSNSDMVETGVPSYAEQAAQRARAAEGGVS